VQEVVHKLEEGGWVWRVKVVILLSALAFMTYLWFFREVGGFKGLANEKVMEQAQIAREISRGHGFSTNVIRPAAIRQFERSMGSFPLERTPDTYHAPLNPYINALVFKTMDASNERIKTLSQKSDYFDRYTYEPVMTTKARRLFVRTGFIAFVQLVFFLLAMAVNYFIALRLFDRRLANLGSLSCFCVRDFGISRLPDCRRCSFCFCSVAQRTR